MATSIIPNNQKAHLATQLIESVNEEANSSYYFFISDHLENTNTVVESVSDTVKLTMVDVHKNMIQGKRISASDMTYLIFKNEYVSNTAYDMYEHDADLTTKNFYVSVDEGSYIHVYKCLDNNLNDYSTVQPNFSHISGANTLFYRTSDGYAWKYMYSFSSTDKLKFSTSKYIPVIANTIVETTAQSGVVDVIKVEGTGRKYDNYLTGSWGISDLRVGGNSIVYQVDTTAKNSNSFYSGCLLYVSSGVGAGQSKEITEYFSNNSGKYVVVNSAFSTAPTNSSEYQIYPKVNVYGTSRETSPVVARALVNALASNSIYRVEILDKGAGFTYHATANVYANSVVGVQSPAELKVILPPSGGHGSNAITELYSNKVEISVKLSNNESNTISVQNGFKQIGIIKDPMFANVVLTIQDKVGSFVSDEMVYKISPQKIASGASMNTTSNVVTVTLDSYYNGIATGDKLYLATNTASQFVSVSAVNTSAITLATNGFFSSSNALVYFAKPTSQAYVYFSNGVSLSMSNCYGIFSNTDLVIGELSGARATVNAITRSGVAKGFNTFINMTKLSGSLTSGTFDQNETIYAGSIATANALLHSTESGSSFDIYATNLLGNINNSSNTVIGANSGAVATFSEKYDPEIEYGSGDIIFIENLDRITRSANTSETFQIIFDF